MSKIDFQPNGHFNINGIDVHPGSDIDADLITVNVTPGPVFKWDQSASSFSVNAGLRIQPITDSVTAVQILDSDGGTPVFNVDTVNERVGIRTATPSQAFEVVGTTIIREGTRGIQFSVVGANAIITKVGGGNIRVDSTLATSAILPRSTNTYDLGTNSNRWQDFYTVNGFFSGKIAVNAISNTGLVDIIGDADEIQLLVKAHSEQGANLVEFQDSDGNVDSKISGDRGAAFGAFDDGNYTEVEADGTVVFKGVATVFKDINMGAAVLTRPAVSQPDEVPFVDENGADTGIASLGFAVGEKVSGNFELEHDYKEGSDLVFHVHWQGVAAPSGTDKVQWQLTYTVSQSETTLDATTTIVIETDFDTQYEFKASAFPAITGTDFNIEDQFLFTLERIAASADEYAGDGIVATVGIHYEVDTVGSRQVLVK